MFVEAISWSLCLYDSLGGDLQLYSFTSGFFNHRCCEGRVVVFVI